MAKIKTCIWLFCFILCGLRGSSQDIVRQCVQETYTSQIGVREATGNNDGEEVEGYLRASGFGKGFAWCAAFVNWCYAQCGVLTVDSPAWSPSWFSTENVIYEKGGYIKSIPRAADVFGLYYRSKNRIAHVGFIAEDWNYSRNYAITVEGNTNNALSREGDGVYKKKRFKSSIYKVARYVD